MIEVDDEEKAINAIYLMKLITPWKASEFLGNRIYSSLYHFSDLLGTDESIGLMIFLNRSGKV